MLRQFLPAHMSFLWRVKFLGLSTLPYSLISLHCGFFSLITDVEHPFMCLYVSSMFSLVMGLTKLFPKLYIPFFLDEFSVLLCIICINEHMYELTFFSWFANIFYNCNFLFIMLTVSSEEFTFLILMKLNLQFFLLQIMPLALSKISLKTKYHRDFPLCSFLDLLNF